MNIIINNFSLIDKLAPQSENIFSMSQINKLKLEDFADVAENRYILFSCPLCGDLGCGAITVEITADNNFVYWKNFAYEYNYKYDFEDDPGEKYSIGPYKFDKKNYLSCLNNAYKSSSV